MSSQQARNRFPVARGYGDNNDDDSTAYSSVASSVASSVSAIDLILDKLEQRRGFKFFQAAISIWAIVAVAKNLGVGKHVYLDPADEVEKEAHGLRLSHEAGDRPRFALVRPFARSDVETLLKSFELWDSARPCGNYKTEWNLEDYTVYGDRYAEDEHPIVDLVISFSGKSGDIEGYDTLSTIQELFDARNGWGGCFSEFVSFEAGINPEDDIYDHQPIQTNPHWVNGPNEQFRKNYRFIKNKGYASMIMMESDVQPQVDGWLDLALSEVKRNQPFAVLGSKYSGNSWDNFREEIPTALLDHINGNAIYNTTHPLLEKMVNELEKEKNTIFNAIPFDYRMSQMWTEGSKGIPSDFPFKSMIDPATGNPVVLDPKMNTFRQWYEEYGNEQPIKQAHVIENYGATNFLPQQVEGVPLVHGKGLYIPNDPNLHKITLVITDWQMDRANQLLEALDNNDHPFTEVVVMRTWKGWAELIKQNSENTGYMSKIYSILFGDDNSGELHGLSTKVRIVDRVAPEYMDLCEAPVETEYFMITNSYHRVAPDISHLMFTSGDVSSGIPSKPVIPYTPSEMDLCQEHVGCLETVKLGREIYPNLDKVVLDFEMVFETSTRNEFCKYWKGLYGQNGAKLHKSYGVVYSPEVPHGPSATSYTAYLYSLGIAESLFEFSDKSRQGSRDIFVKVLEGEEESNYLLNFWKALPPQVRNKMKQDRLKREGEG
uniref:Uncharacterized protein n=1 Tax=Ditylum brightwellii TaxID=49249 RepID=A0A7S4RRC4_9STRA